MGVCFRDISEGCAPNQEFNRRKTEHTEYGEKAAMALKLKKNIDPSA